MDDKVFMRVSSGRARARVLAALGGRATWYWLYEERGYFIRVSPDQVDGLRAIPGVTRARDQGACYARCFS